MDEQIIQDILTEVFSALEPLDARSAGILQFLKTKGLATEEELAPFLDQAENASNVRWLAARVRIASLLSSALKPTETQSAAEQSKPTERKDQPESAPQSAHPSAADSKPMPSPAPGETAENKKENAPMKSEQPVQQASKSEGATGAKDEARVKETKEKAA